MSNLDGELMGEIRDDINDIKISVARIEEHLKGINGSVERYNAHMITTCPRLHKEIDRKFYTAMGIFSAIMFLINLLFQYLF